MYTTLFLAIITNTIFMEVWKETFKYPVKIIFTQGTICQAMNSKKRIHAAYSTICLHFLISKTHKTSAGFGFPIRF